jgi:SAM-dependent methyltransferase
MVKMEDKRKAGQMQAPDPWIKRHIDLFLEGGKVLDLAAGAGRHTLLSIALGHPVVAVDRDTSRLKKAASGNPDIRQHDLEARAWPLEGERFHGIIVCNYLWRPLFPAVAAALEPGGVLLWTTFALGNEEYGRPRNPEFLLRRNELITAFATDLEVIAFEDRILAGPQPAVRQSLCARRPVVDPG